MTMKEHLEIQWNSGKLGSAINRVRWVFKYGYLMPKAGTKRGRK